VAGRQNQNADRSFGFVVGFAELVGILSERARQLIARACVGSTM
jgi:hypothetical protein